MPAICLYFQVHQPYRVKKFRVFDIGTGQDYFDDPSESNLNNRRIISKVAQKCYQPASAVLLELLHQYPELKISFSFSGVLLEQLEEFSPSTLQSFQALAKTGQVELLSETYYHSLSFLYSRAEFASQVKLHRKKIKSLFNQTPKIFRNTELIYNNELAWEAAQLGFTGILAEGADHILGWRSPNFLYSPPPHPEYPAGRVKLLLKNYRLSDDIAFRFSTPGWSEYPLFADKYASWISAINGSGEIVNLFLDYETFGEHQWSDTGIFEFLRHLPGELLKHPDNYFVTPSQAVSLFPSRDQLDIPGFISWADIERDISAWLGNPIQDAAASKLYALEEAVLRSKNRRLISDWRRLQTSDHFYYMCTKWFADGDVHKYFNPYESPYSAFISFANVLADLRLRLESRTRPSPRTKSADPSARYRLMRMAGSE